MPTLDRTLAYLLAATIATSALARQNAPAPAVPDSLDLPARRAESPFLPADFTPDAAAPFADFSTSWPARVAPISSPKSRGIILPIDVPDGWRVIRFTDRRIYAGYQLNANDQADATALLGDYRKTTSLSYEGPGSILFAFDMAGPDDKAKREDRAAFYFRYISARETTPPGMPRKSVDIQRTWFAFYPASAVPGADANPVVLMIPGMFGTPEPVVNGLVNRLRLRGWPVIRMLSHPSRFTERCTIGINPAAPDTGTAAVAELLGDRAAECAYAASAAFEYVASRVPELKDRPRAAIGFSGGAMAMPTVIALEPDKYQHVIMVGGGADYFLISERSNYATWIDAMTTVWLGPVEQNQKQIIDRSYLNAAKLDAYHTAAALRSKHVLLIQGTIDRAVPSDLGDLLWERLGKPERWLGPQSHESLFLTLPMRFDAIIDWLSGKPTPAPADTAAPDSSGSR